MLIALDVQYDADAPTASAAGIVFDRWDDAVPRAEYRATCGDVQPYEPGRFFKRELPCLLAVLRQIHEPITTVVVDGYVTLGDKPGLGMRLREALGRDVIVIGVAKTRFHSAHAEAVIRGDGTSPLFITSVGLLATEAAERIRRMHGPYRIPTLLKYVDSLARSGKLP